MTTTASRAGRPDAPPRPRREWWIPASLLALTFVPVAAGAARLVDLSSGRTAENARFFDLPVPVVVHILGATTYCVLGAFQFMPSFRRRRPRWHRWSGRVLVPAARRGAGRRQTDSATERICASTGAVSAPRRPIGSAG